MVGFVVAAAVVGLVFLAVYGVVDELDRRERDYDEY